jgi:hypothetical protein
MPKRIDAMRIIPIIMITFILTGAISSCKDDPVTPKPGTCDTCVCDTCDTTDTVTVTPNDTTSHDVVWTEYQLTGEASIGGSWVFNDSTIWIAGNDLYELKGNEWMRITNIGDGTKIFGFTPKDSWLWSSGIVWRYKDEVKKEYRIYQDGMGLLNYPEDGELRAAWGTASTDMYFVGDKGVIVHFDGTNWMKFPKVTQKKLQSI